MTDAPALRDTSDEAANEAADAHARFLSVLAHELRSPLSSLQNWLQVLESQLGAEPTALARRASSGLRESVERQVRRLDALSDASRVLRGEASLSPAPLDLGALLHETVARHTHDAARRQIALACEAATGAMLSADAARLHQILAVLIDNACKFSPPGKTVRLSLHEEHEAWCMAVHDQGQGMDAEQLTQAFAGFERRIRSLHPGLGLNLCVARRLAELHGGTLHAHSAGRDQGARFKLRLPRH